MFPQKSLEAIFERDLDQLPLPDADRWVPTEKRDFFPVVAVAALAIFLMVGLMTVAGIRDQVSSSVLASPPARPTSSGGRLIGPLPNDYRNTEFGYNLIVPAWLRVSDVLPANAATKGLLSSVRFTGRNPEQERAFLASAGAASRAGEIPSWDLVIDVWQRDGLSAEQWATQRDGCGRGGDIRVSACTLGSTVIHGTTAVTAEWTESSGATVHAFYFERGPNILVLRYAIGAEGERPQDVTATLLDQVVRSIGLV
jgi:hypothetical protein